MKSPLIILIELILGLITRASETIGFLFFKVLEFLASLSTFTIFGVSGLLIALVIGTIVVFFAIKFFFKSSKSLIILWLVLIGLVILFILALVIVGPPTPAKTS